LLTVYTEAMAKSEGITYGQLVAQELNDDGGFREEWLLSRRSPAASGDSVFAGAEHPQRGCLGRSLGRSPVLDTEQRIYQQALGAWKLAIERRSCAVVVEDEQARGAVGVELPLEARVRSVPLELKAALARREHLWQRQALLDEHAGQVPSALKSRGDGSERLVAIPVVFERSQLLERLA
jgi:hypothetical protein